MLVYAGIDIAGALNAPTEEYRASGEKFKAWATRYMVPRLDNQVTAEELYRARCGMVHAYSSNSTPSEATAEMRVISYVTYTPEKVHFAERLRTMTVSGHRPDLRPFVIMSVEELAVAYDTGWCQMLWEVLADSSRLPLFERHCEEQFANLSVPIDSPRE